MLFRLPVTGADVWLRAPSGTDDLLLAEASALDTRLAASLLASVGRSPRGEVVDWGALPVSDLEAALLRLRQALAGDHVKSDVRCPSPKCGARVDITFRLSDYVAHHAPDPVPGVAPSGEAPWLSLEGRDIEFRPPTVEDRLATSGERSPAEALRRRCVRPLDLPDEVMARVEEALESVAPTFAGEVEGTCPECGGTVSVTFDPEVFVLSELRDQALSVYEEVHALASEYGWTEEAILRLPRTRRARYAELALGAARGG